MLVLRYYRQYLWVFFYLFFLLMAVSLIADVSLSSSSGSTGNLLKLPRFVNVVLCFGFSGLSVLLQNYSTRRLLALDDLQLNKTHWSKRKVKVTKNTFQKRSKKSYVSMLLFMHSFANLLHLLPVVVVLVLWSTQQLTSLETNGNKVFHKWFFMAGALIKYASWYCLLFSSKFVMFWGKSRLKELA